MKLDSIRQRASRLDFREAEMCRRKAEDSSDVMVHVMSAQGKQGDLPMMVLICGNFESWELGRKDRLQIVDMVGDKYCEGCRRTAKFYL
jgi:hypothetical protein